MVHGILLAAGSSERFGTDKRLHEVGGKPLIYYSLRACLASSLTSILVIVAPSQRSIVDIVTPLLPEADRRVRFVENQRAQRGQMSSVKAGLRELPPGVDGAMMFLADMPLVPSGLIDDLIRVFDETHSVVVSENNGRHYHPKIIPRELFANFLALDDGAKGTQVLDAVRETTRTVHVPDARVFCDVDTPEDLKRLGPLLD